MFVLLNYFILMVGVLIGVAFLTFFERKILGYIQLRKGPNKVGYLGILQPFSDAIKLFSKESMVLGQFNYLLYYVSPMLSLFLMLLGWMTFPLLWGLMDFGIGILFMLCVMSVGVYSMLWAGWSSNSKYSLLGGLRSVAQTISYEVSFSLILISLIFMIMSYDLVKISYFGFVMMFFFPIFFCWFISVLAELNRTPFDFAEGESELVSGFNVEYSGVGFALIFMAEYGSIIFLSMVSVVIFLGIDFLVLKVVFFSMLIIAVRGSYPRYRYDKLMYFAWKVMLPVVLILLLYLYGMVVFFL